MGLYTSTTERPPDCTLNPHNQLAQGLLMGGFGRHPKTTRYHDSSLYNNHGTLTAMDPATDWSWSQELGRWTVLSAQCNLNNAGTSHPTKPPLPASFACWVKIQTGQWQDLLKNGPWTGTYNGLLIEVQDDNKIISAFGNDGGSGLEYLRQFITTPTLAAVWTHVACVFTSSLITTYINGLSVAGTASGTATTMTYSTASSYIFTVGTIATSIADPVLYNRALSAAEIAILANRSDPMLGGLILPPRRKLWTVPSGGATQLTVANAECVTESTAPALVQHYAALTIGNAESVTESTSPTLTQHQVLVVADSESVTESDAVALVHHAVGNLVVQDSECAVEAENVALTQHQVLAVVGSECVVASESPAFTQHQVFSVSDSESVVESDAVILTAHNSVSLFVAVSECLATSDLVVLTQHQLMQVFDTQIVVNSETVTLGGTYAAVVHYHTLEGPSKKIHPLTGPSVAAHILEGPSKQLRTLRGQ